MNQGYNQSNRGGYNSQQSGSSGSGNGIKIPDFDDPEFLGEKALLIAQKINERGSELSKSQLRNFYGEFKNIERLLDAATDENKKTKWMELYPRIKLIRAKAIYNANRDNRKQSIPHNYKSFLEQCVDNIKSEYPENLGKFKSICLLFEAVVGYSSAYAKQEGR